MTHYIKACCEGYGCVRRVTGDGLVKICCNVFDGTRRRGIVHREGDGQSDAESELSKEKIISDEDVRGMTVDLMRLRQRERERD